MHIYGIVIYTLVLSVLSLYIVCTKPERELRNTQPDGVQVLISVHLLTHYSHLAQKSMEEKLQVTEVFRSTRLHNAARKYKQVICQSRRLLPSLQTDTVGLKYLPQCSRSGWWKSCKTSKQELRGTLFSHSDTKATSTQYNNDFKRFFLLSGVSGECVCI